MRAVRAKEIRRAFRAELAEPSRVRWISHPGTYVNTRGENMVKYTFQYVNEGGRRLTQIAKRIYKKHGLLPR